MKTPLILTMTAVAAGLLALGIYAVGDDGTAPSATPAAEGLTTPATPTAVDFRPAQASEPPASTETPGSEPAPEATDPAWADGMADDRFADPSVASTLAALHSDTLSWTNAGAEDLEAYLGDTVSVRMNDGRNIDFRIAELVLGPEEPDRPEILQRRRGVTLVLSEPTADLSTIPQLGARLVSVFHHGLGEGSVMLGIYPNADGSREAEIVLN